METKDLVLLLLMPIILISILVYTDKSPVITGLVTAEKKESNIIGSYYINPSFRVKVDYDLKDYENIKKELDAIIKKCDKKQDIEQCLKDNTPLNWRCPDSKPESQEEAFKILDDFITKFTECLNLEEDGLVCRFSLDKREINNRPFNIRLTSDGQTIQADLIEGNNIRLE